MNNDIKHLPSGDFEVTDNQLALAMAYHVKLMKWIEDQIRFESEMAFAMYTPADKYVAVINSLKKLKTFAETELLPSKVKPETTGWIPIGECFPEIGEAVQGYTDTGKWFPYIWIAHVQGRVEWMYANLPDKGSPTWLDINSGHKDRITHWMPLPELPKE